MSVMALLFVLTAGVIVLLSSALAVYPSVTAVIIGFVFAAGATFLVSARLALFVLLVATLAVIGPVQTLGRVDRMHWVPYLLSLLLVAKAAGMALGQRFNRVYAVKFPLAESTDRSQFVALLTWALVAIAAFATLLDLPGPFQVLLGTRDYLWLWGAMALVVASRMNLQELSRFFVLMPWVVVAQVPLVIYQRFALSRGSVATRDAVVGLFSGNPDGGGASGAMGIFTALMAAYVVMRARAGLTSWWFALIVGTSAVISIGLAEVKFVAMIAPLVFVAILGFGTVLRNPRVLIGIMVLAVSAPLILYGYWKSFEGVGAKTHASFDRYIELTIERNLDDRDIHSFSGEISRAAALKFWWQQANFSVDPVGVSVGHGVGATRIGAFPGSLARKYTFKIARSSMAVLLWEVGVIGTLVAVALLLTGWRRAITADRLLAGRHAEGSCLMRLSAGVMVAAILYLPYNTDLVGTPQAQLLFVLCCAAIWRAHHDASNFTAGAVQHSARAT